MTLFIPLQKTRQVCAREEDERTDTTRDFKRSRTGRDAAVAAGATLAAVVNHDEESEL